MKRAIPPRVRLYACIAAAEQHVHIGEVLGQSRTRPAVLARWSVMRRLRNDGFSTTQIGRWLDRDHSTVIYGLRNEAMAQATHG